MRRTSTLPGMASVKDRSTCEGTKSSSGGRCPGIGAGRRGPARRGRATAVSGACRRRARQELVAEEPAQAGKAAAHGGLRDADLRGSSARDAALGQECVQRHDQVQVDAREVTVLDRHGQVRRWLATRVSATGQCGIRPSETIRLPSCIGRAIAAVENRTIIYGVDTGINRICLMNAPPGSISSSSKDGPPRHTERIER